MPTTKLELMTHPVRLRILLALAGQSRTTQQIAAVLDDVPTSSLYRQIQRVLDAGLIEVVAERPVRGTVEKTLRLVTERTALEPGLISAEDVRRSFLVFMTQLYHELDRYLAQPDADPVRDMAGFRTATLYATDAEWTEALSAMAAALVPLLANEPRPDRRLRRFASVSLVAPRDDEENT